MAEAFPHFLFGPGRVRFQVFGPKGQVGPEPVQGLLAPAGPLFGVEVRAVCSLAGACQGCGTGSVVAVARWANHLGTNTPQAKGEVRQSLGHWQRDPDLAGLRDPAGLAKLPPDEPEACRKLWAEVAALLKRASQN